MIVRSYNPIWSFVDLNGNQLDDSYYLFTLQNTLPYLPSPIWKDASQINEWSDPIQFLANGTLPENMYWDDELTYRLEIRQGNTQFDPLIYVVENYQPESGGAPNPGTIGDDTTNQITNPQFATLNFEGTLTISTATTTEIAPGWFIVTTGTGTLAVSQVTYTGDTYTQSNATNAATGLSLINNGFTLVELKQRFYGNGALWTGAETPAGPGVAVSITGSSSDPATVDAWVKYSGGIENTKILSAQFNLTNADYEDAKAIPISTNTDQPDVAYTDFVIQFTANTTVNITSVQLIGQQLINRIKYMQTTPERQIDEEFNVYKPQLEYKPIPSYLVGWDFPFNPAQLFGSAVAATAIGANKSKYVWDQTIIFQSANSGVGTSRGTSGELLLTASATTQMGLIQYLGQQEARKILNSPICCNVSARASVATVATVTLWYTTNPALPNINTGTNDSVLAGLNANGRPSGVAAGWTEVPHIGNPAQFTIEPSGTLNFNDYSFAGWDMKGVAAVDTATFFAIIIGTASVSIGNTIGFNSVSLQSGTIATRPAPQTFDEVLRECQYYYEKSTDSTVPITSAGVLNTLTRHMNSFNTGGQVYLLNSGFGVDYQEKRVSPSFKLYDEGAVVNNVTAYTYGDGAQISTGQIASTNWDQKHVGTKSAQYVPNNSTVPNQFIGVLAGGTTRWDSLISFHFEADARLGII